MIARKPCVGTPHLGAAMARSRRTGAASLLAAMASMVTALAASGASIPDPLPDPDGKPADMSKPVQVYILMGQSNMLGFGNVGQLKGIHDGKGKYPYLFDDAGNFTVRKDARNVRVMCSGNSPARTHKNDWLSAQGGHDGKHIGPEIGIGYYVAHVTDAPVMILKSCIGNRSLGWDLLPPGSESYEYNGKTCPGYGKPEGGGWYAGCQYDGDTAAAKNVLAELGNYYPGATRYEVAGFFFWQGDKDFRNDAHSQYYEKNLVNLIAALRKDFNSPEGKFVVATLGQTDENAGGNQGKILKAQLAIGDWNKYPQFKGTTAGVYSRPFCHGSSSSGHYGGNAETYMDIGEAMGKAMAQLIVDGGGAAQKEEEVEEEEEIAEDKPDPSVLAKEAEKLLKIAREAERMRQRPIARVFYRKIVKDCPDTPAAEEAKKRLERLE